MLLRLLILFLPPPVAKLKTGRKLKFKKTHITSPQSRTPELAFVHLTADTVGIIESTLHVLYMYMYWDKGLKMGKRGNKVPLRPGGCTAHMEHCQKHSCWPKSLVWTGQMQCCFIDFKSYWRCYVPNLATAFRPQLRAGAHTLTLPKA